MTPSHQSYRRIPLSQGLFALVSSEDYDRVAPYKWWVHSGNRIRNIYARGHVVIEGKRVLILLHRFILPGSPIVDHRNGNGLDCRRENLRTAPTMGHNVANQAMRNKTGYKGVGIRGNKFAAMIGCVYLGVRSSAEEAARLYDEAARERWGEFAQVNFP